MPMSAADRTPEVAAKTTQHESIHAIVLKSGPREDSSRYPQMFNLQLFIGTRSKPQSQRSCEFPAALLISCHSPCIEGLNPAESPSFLSMRTRSGSFSSSMGCELSPTASEE
jgi:hypothetical protein